MGAWKPRAIGALAAICAASIGCALSAGRPAWIDDPYLGRSRTSTVAAVGAGVDRQSAANAARAELSRGLVARVQGRLETTLRGQLASGGDSGDGALLHVIDQVVVETDVALRGTEIAATHRDPDGTHWALAILDRRAMQRSLRDQIAGLDARIEDGLARAEAAPSPLERARALLGAIGPATERAALAGPLRTLGGEAPDAVGGFSESALVDEARRALRAVHVGVDAREVDLASGREGAPDAELRSALATVVSRSGLGVTSGSDGGTDGLILRARLGMAPLDRGIPGHATTRWDARYELRSRAQGGPALAVGRASGDECHPSRDTARALARRRGQQALVRDLERDLEELLVDEARPEPGG